MYDKPVNLNLKYNQIYQVIPVESDQPDKAKPFQICLDFYEGKESLMIYLDNCDMPVVTVREPELNNVEVHVDTSIDFPVELTLGENNRPEWIPF